MISGILIISISFISAVVATAAYWIYYREKNEKFLTIANRAFVLHGSGVVLAVILLYYQIFTHNFQLNYVYSYTSLKLNTFYLISTFWAGQEGTFLLWLLFGFCYGIILSRNKHKKQPMVLFFFMLVQSFLLLILLKKSPFAMIWHAQSGVPVGITPADGASLNPLLQNPWMIIHPPIMFMGYSSTVVAFAFALNAMVQKKLQEWVTLARPWVIFATLTLGTGIILGGYWSYVTLGWGGYWAWDPVENASFVPWVIAAALLHGIIIQIRQKGLVKTNLFLAGLSFISVLWGSFLTRSGVLSDFSVHSFAASDLNLYLIALVGFFSIIFLYQFINTIQIVDSPKFAEGLFSRETFILIGILTLLFTGITVFIGTSSPIITGVFGKASNVSIGFYNAISIPIAIFLLISMAIAPLLAWKVSGLKNLKVFIISGVITLLLSIMVFVLGMKQLTPILLFFLSSYAILLNGYFFFQIARKVPAKVGGYLAHMGIAFMVIGIITSSLYDRSEKVTLPVGELVDTDFGYNIQFLNFTQAPDGRDRVNLIVEKNGKTYQANPQFYFSEYTKSYMLSPHVNINLDKDVYISPISYMPAQNTEINKVELKKEESKEVDDLEITFNKFIVGDHVNGSGMMVKADLTVSAKSNNYKKEYSVVPAMGLEAGKMQSTPVEIPGTDYKLKLEQVDANSGTIVLSIISSSANQITAKDILAVEVSEKPFISLLWIGTIILIIGITIALINRIKIQES